MDEIYRFLGLDGEKELNLSTSVDQVSKHVKSKSKKLRLEAESGNILNISVKYSLKGENWNGPIELQIIEIEIREPKKCKPIIEAFENTMPYPVLLVFVSEEKYLLSYFDSENHLSDVSKAESRWLYEEEFYNSFLEYNSIELDHTDNLLAFELDLPATEEDRDAIDVVLGRFSIIVEYFEDPEYICLRMLIDLLKIREAVWGESYIDEVLQELYDNGDLFLLDDYLYVTTFTDADSAFRECSGNHWGNRNLLDERYGSDMHFYELTERDFTTKEETEIRISDVMSQDRDWIFAGEDDDDNYDNYDEY